MSEISIVIKRTYAYGTNEPRDSYVLAGTREECVARVERMIRNNPKALVRKSAHGATWHIAPPGGDDQGFFGHQPLDLLIVEVPTN